MHLLGALFSRSAAYRAGTSRAILAVQRDIDRAPLKWIYLDVDVEVDVDVDSYLGCLRGVSKSVYYW